MAIGEKILKAVQLRDGTEQKVRDAFKAAIEDAKANGVEIEDVDLRGNVYKATFNGYEVKILVDAVAKEFKINGTVQQIAEAGIINVVHELILKQLSY